MTQPSIFLPIAGYEGIYEVSSDGIVRSLDRIMPSRRWGSQRFRGRDLKPLIHADGYHNVILRKEGRFKGFLIHRLVAMAFIGPVPDGMQVNHKDGVKANNSVENLEYVTASENCRHRERMGLRVVARGESSGQSKLTESQVIFIRSNTLPVKDAAVECGVSTSTIRLIRKGKIWQHLS